PAPHLLDDINRNDGQHEVDQSQEPEPSPIVPNFGETRTQLVDSDNAIDREVDGEEIAQDENRTRDRFARPRKSRDEELRQAGGEKYETRRFRTLEPGPNRLGHEAAREQEYRSDRQQLQRVAERREAVDVGQHNNI